MTSNTAVMYQNRNAENQIAIKPLVVRKMGILATSSDFQNCIKKTNKIPDYARDFKNDFFL